VSVKQEKVPGSATNTAARMGLDAVKALDQPITVMVV
jgi:hypothetical protein